MDCFNLYSFSGSLHCMKRDEVMVGMRFHFSRYLLIVCTRLNAQYSSESKTLPFVNSILNSWHSFMGSYMTVTLGGNLCFDCVPDLGPVSSNPSWGWVVDTGHTNSSSGIQLGMPVVLNSVDYGISAVKS